MPTIKLYDDDAYTTTFSAKVLSCTPADTLQNEPDDSTCRYAIELDRTAFFPEEGGQTPDRGAITITGDGHIPDAAASADGPYTHGSTDGSCAHKSVNSPCAYESGEGCVRVLDVQLADDTILHFCDAPLPAGALVTGRIDWPHRYSNMQQHTGEHIFSGIVHSALGYDNVGFHLSDNIVTMDYNGAITDEQIADFEQRANEWIFKNVPVTACYPSVDDLCATDYRSKDGIRGAVRIVTIEGCDICACCAPHVASTGEVGILKVIDRTPYKGGIRLSILCGMRALLDYREKQNTLTALSRLLSKPMGELAARTEALFAERDDLKQQLYLAKKEQLDAMVAAVPVAQNNVCLFISSCDMNLARKTVNLLTEAHPGYCAICVGTDTGGYSFILGSAEGRANEAADMLRKRLSAKCGGKDAMIQGSIHASADAIRELFYS
ncbi:MAG: hypothetical protein IJT32_00215 [Lachnospiraceae bacterium]|nr:hypothetical protein [Lachnospiraceae bacterium]